MAKKNQKSKIKNQKLKKGKVAKKVTSRKSKKTSVTSYIPIGGMPLSNGVMMRSANYMAIAMSDDVGKIEVQSFKLKNIREKYSFLFLPFIRGITFFIENILFLIKALWHKRRFVKNLLRRKTRSQRLFIRIDQYILYIVYLLIIIAFFNYLYIDIVQSSATAGAAFLYNFLLSWFLIIFFGILVALVTIGRRKSLQIFSYHGAEHMTINYNERLGKKTKDSRIYNDRCILVVGFWASVFLALLITFLKVPEYGPYGASIVVIGLILISFSFAYELTLGLSTIEGSIFNLLFIKPLNILQYFFLANPEEQHLIVAWTALDEVLRLEKKHK